MADKKEKKAPEKDMKKDAKLTALKDMRSMASDMMGEGLKGAISPKMKSQVTVAADSPENLKKGLDKAKEMVPDLDSYMADHKDMTKQASRIMKQGDSEDHTQDDESDDNEELHDEMPEEGSPEEEASESPDEEIAELEAKLAALKAKHK